MKRTYMKPFAGIVKIRIYDDILGAWVWKDGELVFDPNANSISGDAGGAAAKELDSLEGSECETGIPSQYHSIWEDEE